METLSHFLELIQKYINRKILLSYDPIVPWRHHLGQMVEILYFKNVTSTKLSALRSTNCLFLKSTIKYLPKDGSTVLIAHAVQNLWASNYWRGYLFQTNCTLRVVNVRRSILFNVVKNWNQTTFKSCMAGVSAFGWFLVILPSAGCFCAISDYFMICTIYMIYFF